jgi:hypothetical protein
VLGTMSRAHALYGVECGLSRNEKRKNEKTACDCHHAVS